MRVADLRQGGHRRIPFDLLRIDGAVRARHDFAPHLGRHRHRATLRRARLREPDAQMRVELRGRGLVRAEMHEPQNARLLGVPLQQKEGLPGRSLALESPQ